MDQLVRTSWIRALPSPLPTALLTRFMPLTPRACWGSWKLAGGWGRRECRFAPPGPRCWWATLCWTGGPVCSTGQRNTGPSRASACARSELQGTWIPAQLSPSTMISSKILVYHHPPSSSSTEVYGPTRRRKKSLGDLFHNGFRVRSGPSAAEEEPQSFWKSVVSCCRVCASWGKDPPKSIPYSERLPRKEVPSLRASRQVMGFSIPLCLAYPWAQMSWARQKSCPSFLDEYNWSLVLLNVFELLKNIFQKCWGKLGKWRERLPFHLLSGNNFQWVGIFQERCWKLLTFFFQGQQCRFGLLSSVLILGRGNVFLPVLDGTSLFSPSRDQKRYPLDRFSCLSCFLIGIWFYSGIRNIWAFEIDDLTLHFCI